MADQIDPALTGAAYDLANAGYTAMAEPEKEQTSEEIGGDSISLRDAAEQRYVPSDEVKIREYRDGDGKPVDASEAITLDRAVRDYAGISAAEKLLAENETAKALAQRVDALRVEAFARDPEAAEFYGFEQPENTSKTEQPNDEELTGQQTDRAHERPISGLDPGLEKALQHPLVVQAIEQKVREAEKARQDDRDGLAAATQIAQMSFLSQFPEFAGVPPENLPRVLEQIARQDPARLVRIQAMVAATEQMFAQQALDDGRQGQRAQQNFFQFAQAEDGRLEAMLK